MFSHILKGHTIGYLLTRRVFRVIFGLPGFLIDAVIIAPLATIGNERYLDFWKNCNWAFYVDNTPQSGALQPIFAYPGDFIGAVLGSIVGGILGAVFYLPDAILRVISWAYDQIGKACNTFANFIGKTFTSIPVFSTPSNYAEKAWNISAATLGLLLASPFYVAAKAIEFVLPISNFLSNLTLGIGSLVGGIVGTVGALSLYPVKHVCSKAVELFSDFRESVRSISAFIYAKTNAFSWNNYDRNSESLSEAVFTRDPHSQEFRTKLEEYRAKSTTEIIFGSLKVATPQIVPVDANHSAASVLLQYVPNPRIKPAPSNDNDSQPGSQPSAPPERIGEEDHVVHQEQHDGITYQYYNNTPK
ncbi:MAG: hypothetical protein V4501_05230 [Pseudomonadota bacterium]